MLVGGHTAPAGDGAGGPDVKPEQLREGHPTLGPTQLPKEQTGLLSQQLGITARVQAESKAYGAF